MKKIKIKNIAVASLFTAIIAATAWISIPTPFGINLAFSLFGVCLTAFILSFKWSLLSTVAYIALGAVGLPVFSHFSGGPGVLVGASGGFIWGFLLTVIICSLAKNIKTKFLKYLIFMVAVFVCHLFGIIQFSIVSNNNFWVSFLTASLPFLFKDVIFVFIAYMLSKKIKI